jgi:hypothetical protein
MTFTAQGFFSKSSGWVLAGVGCAVVAAWQLAMLRGLGGKSGRTEILVDPERLTRAVFWGEGVERKEWMRSTVAEIGVEADGKLYLRLSGSGEKCDVISGMDRQELEWIGEQIRLKWKMGGGGLVK